MVFRGSKPKAPSHSYSCYKFIETNDGDPSVIMDRGSLEYFKYVTAFGSAILVIYLIINSSSP